MVDVGHLGNPQGFVKLVILSLEPRKLEGNEPKINIFQVFDQNREVIAEMQELQGALNLLQVALGYQVHLGKQDVKKNLLIFGHCQNRLNPPPRFLGHPPGIFFWPEKVTEKNVHNVQIYPEK